MTDTEKLARRLEALIQQAYDLGRLGGAIGIFGKELASIKAEALRALTPPAGEAAQSATLPFEPTEAMMLAWINAEVRPEYKAQPRHLQQIDRDQFRLRYAAMLAATPPLSGSGRQGEPRKFGSEPRGCPTPGACSCPALPRDLILALIEVARMPNIEYVADAHNDAVKKLRAMLPPGSRSEGGK